MTYRIVPPTPEGVSAFPLMVVGECPQPPVGKDWLHEVKIDGWRITLLTDGKGGLRLETKRGRDYTWHFKRPVRDLAWCGHSMILDGEIAVPDPDTGVTRLRQLQTAVDACETEHFVYYAFDLLLWDGKDLRARPIQERKLRLEQYLDRHPLPRVHFVGHAVGDGGRLLKAAKNLGLEGIVSKKLGSPYAVTDDRQPSSVWLKSICNPGV